MIGRQDYFPAAFEQRYDSLHLQPTHGDGPPQASAAGKSDGYGENLGAILDGKADENFELGIAYFRNGDHRRAKHCFRVVKTLEGDRPRAFVADVFVAYETRDYNRAVLSLRRALERSEALSDLKIDGFIDRMYQGSPEEKRRAFRRTVESVNLDVKSRPGAPRLNLLLAYFAWLNGDVATAISAASLAESVMGERERPVVATFRQRLSSEMARPPDSAPGT
jgi:tetratricopeptide (TPR) repeat protein